MNERFLSSHNALVFEVNYFKNTDTAAKPDAKSPTVAKPLVWRKDSQALLRVLVIQAVKGGSFIQQKNLSHLSHTN